MALEPDVPYNYDQLGAVCFALNQLPEAEGHFQQALRLDSSLATSRYGLAKIYREQARYADAQRLLDQLAASDPRSASVHYLRGQVLFGMGRRPESRQAFDEALRLKQETLDRLERKISGPYLADAHLAREGR